MIRLIEKGLMFGNLVHISSPALVERYNRALQHLAGKGHGVDGFSCRYLGLFAGGGH